MRRMIRKRSQYLIFGKVFELCRRFRTMAKYMDMHKTVQWFCTKRLPYITPLKMTCSRPIKLQLWYAGRIPITSFASLNDPWNLYFYYLEKSFGKLFSYKMNKLWINLFKLDFLAFTQTFQLIKLGSPVGLIACLTGRVFDVRGARRTTVFSAIQRVFCTILQLRYFSWGVEIIWIAI